MEVPPKNEKKGEESRLPQEDTPYLYTPSYMVLSRGFVKRIFNFPPAFVVSLFIVSLMGQPPSQPILQLGDQKPIRRQRQKRRQRLWRNPTQRLPLLSPHNALPNATNVERHQQVKILVGMARESKGCKAGMFRLDTKLFSQLA